MIDLAQRWFFLQPLSAGSLGERSYQPSVLPGLPDERLLKDLSPEELEVLLATLQATKKSSTFSSSSSRKGPTAAPSKGRGTMVWGLALSTDIDLYPDWRCRELDCVTPKDA